MKKEVTIQLDNEEKVIIKKLPIGGYADLIRAIKKLPKYLQTFENLNTDKLIEQLPTMVSECLPDVVGVIAIAANLPQEKVEALGLDEIIKLIKAVFEVNNYAEVYEFIKKALAHPALKKVSEKAPKIP